MQPQDSIRFVPGRDNAGPENIAAKIARVMGHINGIAREGYNEHFRYAYLTISQVVDTLRPLMAAENLVMLASIRSVQDIVKNNTVVGVTVDLELSLVCGDTGAMLVCDWRGEAQDKQDKAINKAVRAAQKYFLMVTFGISEANETEADGDGGADGHRQPKPRDYTPQELQGKIDALYQAVKEKTGSYYNTAADIQAAIKVEKGDAWEWPHPGAKNAWNNAYAAAVNHWKKQVDQPSS